MQNLQGILYWNWLVLCYAFGLELILCFEASPSRHTVHICCSFFFLWMPPRPLDSFINCMAPIISIEHSTIGYCTWRNSFQWLRYAISFNCQDWGLKKPTFNLNYWLKKVKRSKKWKNFVRGLDLSPSNVILDSIQLFLFHTSRISL